MIDTPPSLHRYLYAYQNPTVYVDPTGREPEKKAGRVRVLVDTALNVGRLKAREAEESGRERLDELHAKVQLDIINHVPLPQLERALEGPDPIRELMKLLRSVHESNPGIGDLGGLSPDEIERRLREGETVSDLLRAARQASRRNEIVLERADEPSGQLSDPVPSFNPSGDDRSGRISGETRSTAGGRQAHSGFAAERREQRQEVGLFDLVNEAFRDSEGNPILVPSRVDLETGEPQPWARLQQARPDAVSFERGLILDDKPEGRPLSKDRQEMIRNIKAYEKRTGRLPEVIAIQRYDPRTGEPLYTELYHPQDFLPPTERSHP